MSEQKQITVDEVKQTLEEIKELALLDDCEKAHSKQDFLYFRVLKAIANGADNATELARETIKAEDIDFDRWMA